MVIKVYTYGVFDLLHIGHIKSLKQAKKHGEFLIVGVFTDKVAKSFKRKPIINEKIRKMTIEELGIADLVVYQREKSPIKNIESYKIDVVAKGKGAGFEYMSEFPCKKVNLKYCDLISTSYIIRKIRRRIRSYDNSVKQFIGKNVNPKTCDYKSKSCVG